MENLILIIIFIAHTVTNATAESTNATTEREFTSNTTISTLTDEAQDSPPTLLWIVAGVVGGLALLIGVLLVVITVMVVVTKKRRKKKYIVNGQDIKISQRNTSNVTNSKLIKTVSKLRQAIYINFETVILELV
jgi:hypothetical protein